MTTNSNNSPPSDTSAKKIVLCSIWADSQSRLVALFTDRHWQWRCEIAWDDLETFATFAAAIYQRKGLSVTRRSRVAWQRQVCDAIRHGLRAEVIKGTKP